MSELRPIAALLENPPILDRLGRPMHDLRVSVMDRCNFRCPYCMPATAYGSDYQFLDDDERLSFDEIERVCRLAAGLGITKVRLTGGEPLLRPRLAELVGRLRPIPGIRDLALTTNGVLLPRQARALRQAGLDRVTISLDTLDPGVFQQMSGGRGSLDNVLAGIRAAQEAEFPGGIKINTVVQRGINDHTVLDLVEYFRGTGIVPRFIEFMDVGSHNDWRAEAVVPSSDLITAIGARWPLEVLPATYPGEVACRFRFLDGQGEIGVVSSVSQPFCGGCSRARLSSDGFFHTCLFSTQGTDLRRSLRDGSSDQYLRERLGRIWSHRADRYSEMRNERGGKTRLGRIEMHYIGG